MDTQPPLSYQWKQNKNVRKDPSKYVLFNHRKLILCWTSVGKTHKMIDMRKKFLSKSIPKNSSKEIVKMWKLKCLHYTKLTVLKMRQIRKTFIFKKAGFFFLYKPKISCILWDIVECPGNNKSNLHFSHTYIKRKITS